MLGPLGVDARLDRVAAAFGASRPLELSAGRDREAALARTRQALRHLRVAGVETTAGFALDMLEHPDVVAGNVHTRWVEEEFLPTWAANDEEAL